MATLAPVTVEQQVARETPAPPTRRRRARLARTGVRLATTLAVVTAAWWFLAPVQIGGSTAFTTVDGTSMFPKLKPNELVVLRSTDNYRVGDVVGYRSRLLHRVVLHRIAAIHGKHYVFKGDHNTFLDPDHPTRDELVGKLWVHLPRAGTVVGILSTPWVAAALAALLVLTLGRGAARPGGAQRQ